MKFKDLLEINDSEIKSVYRKNEYLVVGKNNNESVSYDAFKDGVRVFKDSSELKVFDNGWVLTRRNNFSNLFDEYRNRIWGNIEDAEVFSNNWYSVKVNGKTSLFDEDKKQVFDSAKFVRVYKNGFYKKETFDNKHFLYNQSRKKLVSDAEGAEVLRNDWYAEKKSDLWNIYNNDEKKVISGASRFFDMGYYTFVDGSNSPFDLYDSKGEVLSSNLKSFKKYDNGMSISEEGNHFTIYNSNMEEMFSELLDAKVFKNGWYSTKKEDGWSLYNNRNELITSNLDDVKVLDGDWYAEKHNHRWDLYDEEKKVRALQADDVEVFKYNYAVLNSHDVFTLFRKEDNEKLDEGIENLRELNDGIHYIEATQKGEVLRNINGEKLIPNGRSIDEHDGGWFKAYSSSYSYLYKDGLDRSFYSVDDVVFTEENKVGFINKGSYFEFDLSENNLNKLKREVYLAIKERKDEGRDLSSKQTAYVFDVIGQIEFAKKTSKNLNNGRSSRTPNVDVLQKIFSNER